MLIIGLTGSIGMGKSAAAKRFRERDVPVFDADAAVHEIYAHDAVGPIEAAFPGTTTSAGVDRQALARRLLADASGYKVLESIVHPLVRAAQRRFLADCHAAKNPLVVLEIPLLFETGGHDRVDVTVVVSATAEQQKARVLARPGMTEEKFSQILSRQMPDSEKRRLADFVVDTSGTISETEVQIDRIIETLRTKAGSAFDKHWS